ncbi:hypothetical protein F4677DRAFT_268597 [Hypoxylon crocopeplum]|nr:hypothetical protein F4677DRAFT_268597 [Hypoxylon crocopeplum]
MASLDTFGRFNDLPKELRVLIWEYHFASARLLVVHPTPECQNRNPATELLTFDCTVLDSATNHIILDVRPPSSLINHEAHVVAVSCKRAWTPVRFGKDLTESFPVARIRLPLHFPFVDVREPAAEHDGTQPQLQPSDPIYVDWNRDMLYLSVGSTEQAFWSLRSVSWRDRVRKLAVRVPISDLDRVIPFGPTDPIRETLESLTKLEELFIVLVPHANVVVPKRTATMTGLPRDAFGFAPYVDYLKLVHLARNHILYTRTAMSFREAVAAMRRNIKLDRVVDVDCLNCSFGHYQRSLGPISST